MTLEQLEHIARSEVMFALLFLGFLLWYLRKAAKEREDMRKQAEQHEQQLLEMHNKREDLLTKLLDETRAESKVREGELISNMRKMADQQERIGDTLKEVSTGLAELEKKVDNSVLEIWRTMARSGKSVEGE